MISWIRIRINLPMTSQHEWHMSLFEHFFKNLSLYLEARIRIQIHIRVKSRIRIRITYIYGSGSASHTSHTSKDPDPHQIKIRIQIRIKVMGRIRIRNTVSGTLVFRDLAGYRTCRKRFHICRGNDKNFQNLYPELVLFSLYIYKNDPFLWISQLKKARSGGNPQGAESLPLSSTCSEDR